jgi:GAF domain-containing protein
MNPMPDSTLADPQQIIAQLQRQLAECRAERDEALQRETATAEVLQVINRSPGDLAPVFDALVEKAMRLCEAAHGHIWQCDGEATQVVAARGGPRFAEWMRQLGPHRTAPGSSVDRLRRGEPFIHVLDAREMEPYRTSPLFRDLIDVGGCRSAVSVALRREDTVLGVIAIYRQEVRPFTDRQIALLQNFAAQAVIAMENARLINETREALEQQTATAEVLKVISRSTFDLRAVLQTVVSAAHRLCQSDYSVIFRKEEDEYRWAAGYGISAEYEERERRAVIRPGTDTVIGRAVLAGHAVQIADAKADPLYQGEAESDARAMLGVPLLRDGVAIGGIGMARNRVEPFTDKQVQLVTTFADQAVIAVENARLLGELRGRTRDLQESLEYQTATSDVLKVISRSGAVLQSVLDNMVDTAARICEADAAFIFRLQNGLYRMVASFGFSAEYKDFILRHPIAPGRGTLVGRTALELLPVHIKDAANDPEYTWTESQRLGQFRTMLGLPLLRENAPIGVLALCRSKVEPFTEKQIALITTFADQAVIAIENARLFNELRARTDELTRSVAELQALEEVLRAVNSSLDLDTVLATIISRAAQLSQADEGTIYEFDGAEEVFVPKSAFGMSPERVEALRERRVRLGETHLGRAAIERAPVHVDDVQQDPTLSSPDRGGLLKGIHAVLAVPLLRDDKVVGGLVIRRRTVGGFAPTIPTLLQTFAGQAVLAIENAGLFQEARRARAAAEAALVDLRRAQDRLVQSEKMASLGQLTAGIAHEIKNPLNFVNNFAGLSVELLEELNETARPAIAGLAEDERADVDEIIAMLTGNLEKIAEHGRRADGIVKSMLEHSRGVTGERREVDLNGLVEEALNLAYHGARAQDQNFNITLERDLDPAIAPIELAPQEMTRVLLNLFGNGFYAANKRRRDGAGPDFRPMLKVTTHDLGEAVEIRIRDNGTGIRPEIKDKLFQPFFTTKPTGEGTGLGLSISYDIVTQRHGGTIEVDSEVGAFTEFTVRLPRGKQGVTAGRAA